MDGPIYYSPKEYIETVRPPSSGCPCTPPPLTPCARQDTGNKVSRRATIAGPQNIILGGKTVIARTGPGHAVVIALGRYCLVGEGCVVRCAPSWCAGRAGAR
jgi:hypothetical protein